MKQVSALLSDEEFEQLKIVKIHYNLSLRKLISISLKKYMSSIEKEKAKLVSEVTP